MESSAYRCLAKIYPDSVIKVTNKKAVGLYFVNALYEAILEQ